MPEYHVDESGPDHQKSFRAVGAGSAGRLRRGRGPVQEGSRAAGRRGGLDRDHRGLRGERRGGGQRRRTRAAGRRQRTAAAVPRARRSGRPWRARPGAGARNSAGPARPGDRGRRRRSGPAELACLSFPRSRPSGAVWSGMSPAGPSTSVEVLHPAGRPPAPGRPRRLRRRAARARSHRRAAARGKYLWLPVGDDALLAHLGMSGQLLVGDATAPLSPHVRVRFTFADGGPDLRFIDQRTFGHLLFAPGGARRCPARSRTSPPTRWSRPSTPGRLRRPAPRPAHRDQAGPARPDPGQRRRQHLRRRGPVAGQAALGARPPTALRGPT